MRKIRIATLVLGFLPTLLLVLGSAFMPMSVLADTQASGGATAGNAGGGSTTGKDLSISFQLKNPLEGTDSLQGFLLNVLDAVIYILMPVIVIMMIYAGFLFVTARGNAEKLTQAKNALLYTVIGAAIILGAKGFALAIESTLKQF